MSDIAVVDVWGYNDSVALICAIDNSVIPKSIVPGVPDWFFLADSGSEVHLVWGRDCCVKLRASHIMISGYDGQTSATTEVGWLALLVPVLVNDSVWATRSITSGVPDTYIKPDATRQIFSVSRGYAQGGKPVFESDLPGMHFSIKGVGVFIPFIRVDYDGEEVIGPKWVVPCSPPVLADGYEFDYNLNVCAEAAAVETTAAAPDANM